MKLLIIAQKLDRPETEIIRALSGPDLMIHCMADPSCRNFQSLKSSEVKCTPLTLKNRMDLPAIKAIRSTIKEFGPELVQCLRNNYPLSNALLATLGISVKHVCYRGTMGNLSKWDPGSWMTYLNPRLDKIWCVSRGVEDYLASMSVPAHKLTTIYKGHDPSWYPADPGVTRASLGLPEDAFLIGSSGSLRPLKGIPVLLEAIKQLDEKLNVHCVLVGDVVDEEIHKMLQDSKLADKVTLTGFRTDAPQVIGLCNVFVMSSLRREGLPRSMMEAMARSVPAIVSNIGGMAEVVDDGETGFIVPPGDAQALVGALLKLINNPDLCRHQGEAALEKIKGPLNVQTSAQHLLNVYKELCA